VEFHFLESREVPSKLSSKTKSQPSKFAGGSAKEKLKRINENAKSENLFIFTPKKAHQKKHHFKYNVI
jgi:hypothetical protein